MDTPNSDISISREILKASRMFNASCSAAEREISTLDIISIAKNNDRTPYDITKICLEFGVVPVFYKRHIPVWKTSGQLKLHRSGVMIVGAGGLGGYVTEHLARCGIGNITVIDSDIFEESNLNRQILSSMSSIGKEKAAEAERRIVEINPLILASHIYGTIEDVFKGDNDDSLRGIDLIVDCLDNAKSRIALSDISQKKGLGIIHGAISGFSGQAAFESPEKSIMGIIYHNYDESGNEVSSEGNISFVAGAIASMQASLAIQIILNKGAVSSDSIFIVDMENMLIDRINLKQ